MKEINTKKELVEYIKENKSKTKVYDNLRKLWSLEGKQIAMKEIMEGKEDRRHMLVEGLMVNYKFDRVKSTNIAKNQILIEYIESGMTSGDKKVQTVMLQGVELQISGNPMMARLIEVIEEDFEKNKSLLNYLPHGLISYWKSAKKELEVEELVGGLTNEQKEMLRKRL